MTDNKLEKIEDFLNGKMLPGDRKKFEEELKTDTALLAAYNTYRTVETHMADAQTDIGETTLKNTLTKLGAEFFNTAPTTDSSVTQEKQPEIVKNVQPGTLPENRPRVKRLEAWKLAAAILLAIFAMGAWYILTSKRNTKQVALNPESTFDSTASSKKSIDTATIQNSTSPQLVVVTTDTGNGRQSAQLKTIQQKQLAEKYFEPDAAPENKDGPLEDAFDEYEKRQYTNAAAAFENADLTLATRGETTDTLLSKFYASYYKALSYMAAKKYAKAIPLLKNLNNPNPILQVKVQWYLALAYLRTGNLAKATSLLQVIDQNSEAGAYRFKAATLMIDLKRQRQ